MPDNFQTSPPDPMGDTFAADDISGVKYPRAKVVWGVDGVAVDTSLAAPMPIQAGSGVTLPVSLAATSPFNLAQYGGSAVGATNPVHVTPGTGATFAATQSGTWNVGTLTSITNAVTVDDGGGSLTVDGTLAVTQSGGWSVATVGAITNPVTVQDGGGSLTVDGTVAATQSGTWTVASITNPVTVTGSVSASISSLPGTSVAGTTATTRDYDTSAGTDTVLLVGVALPSASGAVAGGTASNPLRTDPTGTTTQPVSGTVAVTDGGGSLTVDAALSAPVAVRLSDGTNAISTLPVSLASVPSHPVTNAGTFAVQADQSGAWTVTANAGTGTFTTSDVHTTAGSYLAVRLTNGTSFYNATGGGGGGGTQYVQNDASAGGESLTLAGAIRRDTATSNTSADGDYATINVDASGRLWVHVGVVDGTVAATQSGTWNIGAVTSITNAVTVQDGGGAITVDNAGTFAVQAAQSGTWNVGTLTSITNVVNVADNGASLTVDNGGTFAVQASQAGTWNVGTVTTVAAVTSITNAVTVVDGGGSLTVDGTVAATQSGTWNIGAVTSITNTVNVADGGGSLTVDGTVAATQSGAWTVTANAGTGTFTTSDVHTGAANYLAVRLTDGAAFYDASGGGGGGTQYVQNDASAGGESLTLAGAIRRDTATSNTSADGDYATINVDASGRLWVHVGVVDGTVAATQSGTWNIGAVTSITNAVTVQDGGGAITVDNAGTFAVQAAQSGAWTVTANAGTGTFIIGDGGGSITVDGSVTASVTGTVSISGSVTPGTGAANLGKAEDAPHADGDVGVMALAVRKDTAASLAGADGDYIPLITDNTGRVWTRVGTIDGGTITAVTSITNAVSVTNTGTFRVQNESRVEPGTGTTLFSGSANFDVDALDRAWLTINGTFTGVVSFYGVTDGLWWPIFGKSDDNGTLPSGTWKSQVLSGTYDDTFFFDTSAFRQIRVNPSIGTGSLTVSWRTATGKLSSMVYGQSSHDRPAGNEPLLIGAYASSSAPTAVDTNGDAVNLWADLNGRLVVTGSGGTFPVTDSGGSLSVDDGAGSLTVDAPVGTPVFVRLSDGAAAITTLPVAIQNGAVTAKGTQGTNGGVPVQHLHDAGRTRVLFSAVAAAAGATTVVTAITLTKSSGTSATTTGTSFVIPNGKTFRITSIVFATRGHNTATAQQTTFHFRINTAGAVTTSSTPIILQARCATPATANSWDRFALDIGDGIEIPGDGTMEFGLTAVATYTTNAPTWDVVITGYEY